MNRLEQNPFLDPTAAECIETMNFPDKSIAGEVVLPGLFEMLPCVTVPGRACLVQEDNDGFSDPFEQLQFRAKVPGHARFFSRIYEIEDNVRLLLDVQHSLLRTPGRPVTKSIPYFR